MAGAGVLPSRRQLSKCMHHFRHSTPQHAAARRVLSALRSSGSACVAERRWGHVRARAAAAWRALASNKKAAQRCAARARRCVAGGDTSCTVRFARGRAPSALRAAAACGQHTALRRRTLPLCGCASAPCAAAAAGRQQPAGLLDGGAGRAGHGGADGCAFRVRTTDGRRLLSRAWPHTACCAAAASFRACRRRSRRRCWAAACCWCVLTVTVPLCACVLCLSSALHASADGDAALRLFSRAGPVAAGGALARQAVHCFTVV
jgi:hypothetical protein